MGIQVFYRHPALEPAANEVTLAKIQAVCGEITGVTLDTELCFYFVVEQGKDLTADELKKVLWVISIPFKESDTSRCSSLPSKTTEHQLLFEIGPRLNFSTAFSTNAVSICHSFGLKQVTRIEYSTRYLITCNDSQTNGGGDAPAPLAKLRNDIIASLHDKMTQCCYEEPIKSFDLEVKSDSVYEIDIVGRGRAALEEANAEMGLALDEWDLDYYTEMFTKRIKRNPTNVECFDLAQSNSEHSRHWFFKGRMIVDGKEHEDSLFKMVTNTQEHSNQNSVLAFCDNSSAIAGYPIDVLQPSTPGAPGPFKEASLTRDIILTAETHNFPTGVAPFPGATTGTGGRIRDVHATGTGAHVVAGTAGYSFGNLNIPGYPLPWESKDAIHPPNFAPPLEIAVEASNGASDYGNKFGEPVLTGFARSFGLTMPNGERREWVKPIMFSGGLGSMEHIHIKKDQPEKDMAVVKLGGPVYRIGVGGGAASSVQVQGDNKSELDFGAVQRGDAEMEQKMNRVIRACVESGEGNPIRSIHDQGAGGNGNVLKEICEPAGAIIHVGNFQLGDPTLSVLELWGAEYQESNAILVRNKDSDLLRKICSRERCPVSFVGQITGDGKIRLEGELHSNDTADYDSGKKARTDIAYPVDLELDCVLGKMPRKVFNLNHVEQVFQPFHIPGDVTVMNALERVLRLPSVASKRYLTNKVDRSVTGLVAQQQCVGPLHTPLADVAITALSHFGKVGAATAIGEQPIKGMVNPACGARMSVGEALTNLAMAKISCLKDVKCSANWMWAAKLPGEGATLFDACKAMCDVMRNLGVAADGGKDSLSMAARVEGESVKAPGTLVISAYAPCPDVNLTITPDLKLQNGCLLYVPLSDKYRVGGSALAQCYEQVGDVVPDLDDPAQLAAVFNTIQELLDGELLVSGHDISDGGLITCLLEMAFAGNCGINVDIPTLQAGASVMDVLFSEELGFVFEVEESKLEDVKKRFQASGAKCYHLGHCQGLGKSAEIKIKYDGEDVLSLPMVTLRDMWEETSFQLERLQTNPHCVELEQQGLRERVAPPYKLTFDPNVAPKSHLKNGSAQSDLDQPKVAVIREEGSNGDREMVAALHMAGFEVWDINMEDMCSGAVTLDQFRGVVFVGGFSYADVFGSAKGWAATLLFNQAIREQFTKFKARPDTFSLGICNGCQLMGLLGWIAPDQELPSAEDRHDKQGVFLTHNISERFESRFATVKIEKSASMMLKGMEDSTLGVWVAHGEGRMVFKNKATKDFVNSENLTVVKFVDDQGQPTTTYPLNPNGTEDGLAGLCSKDGRHLAMMPHPERTVLPWQWAWMPRDWQTTMKVSPWMRMFQNAYIWCMEN
ncbi:phosphoribosylformylglycinamidine synthase-like [Lineus longissimus]|uniref:phosphoribosylformylglycinamidine synthase-like n=1 Tax=Lineus longissimus TaxID=88925 RepID=UPI002B4D929C